MKRLFRVQFVKRWAFALFLNALLLGLPAQAFRPFSTSPGENVALGGYDPVAYIESGNAVRGAPIFFYEWEEVLWFFKDKANLVKFKTNPKKYSPAVGGYCTFHFSRGSAKSCDPRQFVIFKEKLYVFGSPAAKDQFLQNPNAFIEKANKNYRKALQNQEPTKE